MAVSKWDGTTALNMTDLNGKGWRCVTYAVVGEHNLEMCSSTAATIPEATAALKYDILERISSLEALLRRIERVEDGMKDDHNADHTKTKAFGRPLQDL